MCEAMDNVEATNEPPWDAPATVIVLPALFAVSLIPLGSLPCRPQQNGRASVLAACSALVMCFL
jgi:hypothetical protein